MITSDGRCSPEIKNAIPIAANSFQNMKVNTKTRNISM